VSTMLHRRMQEYRNCVAFLEAMHKPTHRNCAPLTVKPARYTMRNAVTI
jgi:hypothetical protein